jgi:hypothetical protein
MFVGSGLTVARGATRLGMDVECFLQLLTEVNGSLDLVTLGVFRDISVAILKVENLFQWPEVLLRCGMAVEAPAHRVGLILQDYIHLMDITVAALAGNSAVYVGGVVEIYVVR